MSRRLLPSALCLLLFACGESAGPERPPAPEVDPSEGRLRRLTADQYRNAIRDLFGAEIVVPAKLEPDTAIDGLLAIGAGRTTISSRGVDLYEEAAYAIAAQAMAPGPIRDALVPCAPEATVDKECAREALLHLGLRVLRRPVAGRELADLVAIAAEAAHTLGDFHAGFEYAIAALLQSPAFLFRVEIGEPDPERPGRHRYSDYEMASRLSFLFWNTIPDDALLAAAGRGELTTSDGVAAQAARLLDSPRARGGVRAYFDDLLELYRLEALVKDPTLFPHMSPALGPAAREETLRLVDHLIFEADADYRELFTSRVTFLDRRLASLYGVSAPALDDFGRHEWATDAPRAGLLTHASVLALHSHPVASSPTLRGRFVRRTLLCGVIPPPPVEVNTAIPEPSGTAPTLRDRLEEHLQNQACAGCHLRMDPIGLGLENFDGIGRHRALDHGALIDPSGDLDGIGFADARELGRAVAEHPDTARCFVSHVYRYATGRLETPRERALIDHLTERFAGSGHRMRELLVEIALSPGFRDAAPPDPEGGE